MTTEPTKRPIWIMLAGGAIGVAIGIVVSIATDLPLAPEAGLVLGLAVGWVLRRAGS